MKYIYNEKGNKIATHQQATDEELREQYKNESKIYISDTDLGETAIIDKDTIRAKTEVEKVRDKERDLQEGEYIEGNEIKYIEKPNEFYLWDSKKNEWIYDKELEKNYLEEKLGGLELDIYNKQNEISELKKAGKIFAAKKLEKEASELEKQFNENMTRYEELEG